MDFEWDDAKAAINVRKHGLRFEAALGVFTDPWALDIEDDTNLGEQRFNRIGMTAGRMLVVTYTIRGNSFRIISVRYATRKESRRYHETPL